MITVRHQLDQAASALGFDLVGVCSAGPSETWSTYRNWLKAGFGGEMEYLSRHEDMKVSPEALLPGVKSIIAVGLNYYQPVGHVLGHPRIARYALGRDYHKVIRSKLRKLIRALPASQQHRICVDSAPILEREYAQRAGLGWFGKNTMLINSKRGSWFLIGLILTTLEIEADQPATGGCGSCRACIDACPTGAIVELKGRWVVDARECISYLTIEEPDLADERVGEWTFGCDICQEICPFNQPRTSQPLRANPTTEQDFLNHSELVGKSLQEIAQSDQAAWDRATLGSPIRRAGFEGLKRIAMVNMQAEAGTHHAAGSS